MKSRILSIVLVVAMLMLLISGCSTKSEEAPAEPEAPVSEQPSQEDVAEPEPETEPVEESEEEPAPAEPEVKEDIEDLSLVERNTYILPISDELVTYSVYSEWPPVLTQFGENPGETSFVHAELEKLTNIHLDWNMVSTEQASEMFNVMIASGDYCDIIQGASGSYTGGADMAVEDGVIIDLVDYVTPETMPNLSTLLEANSRLKKSMYTTGGKFVSMPKIYEKLEGNPGGLVARADWMEELGLEIPTTYDELHDLLLAFYNEKGATNTLLMSYTGYLNRIYNGYGVPGFGSGAFYVENGVVNYSGLDQNYIDLVKMLSDWYAEGILDHEFYTRTNTRDADTGCIMSGAAGVWDSSVMQISNTSSTGGFTLTPLPDPLLDEEGTDYLVSSDEMWTDYPWNISTSCEDVDTLIKWFDYLYSNDGSFIVNYGVEGETFYYAEDGTPMMADIIIANTKGFPSNLLENVYTACAFPFVYNWEKYQVTYDEIQMNAYLGWNGDVEYNSDRCTYSSSIVLEGEEQIECNNIMSDIATYMEEMFFKVVLGEEDISAMEALEADLMSMNIETALGYKQQAYDDYMAK